MKLIFLVTEDKYFLSHRLPMARAAQNAGFSVVLITNVTTYRAAIEAAGIRVIHLSLDRRSLNPFKAIKHVVQLTRIYQREKPDLVHHIAMKPVLLGAMAAWLARVPVIVNAFAGLGYLFTANTLKAYCLRPPILLFFRILLKRQNSYTLLQNNDDRTTLHKKNLIDTARTVVIPGSGVELAKFPPQLLPPPPPFIVVFAGRMIEIKGLSILKDAFMQLADSSSQIRLWLCGASDPANPGSWTEDKLQSWAASAPNVDYRGHCADMAAIWAQSHVAVQPSLGGEGIPKSLLEAAASARAIVATDVPGCREMVIDGRNGLLIPPHNATALAKALEQLSRDVEKCRAMGLASRELIHERGFDSDAITAQTTAFYRRCLTRV